MFLVFSTKTLSFSLYKSTSTLASKSQKVPLKNIFNFYIDGFKNMKLGKILWKIIIIKLLVILIFVNYFIHDKTFRSEYKSDIDVYFAGDERIIIDEVLNKFDKGELELINLENFNTLFKKDSHNSCSNNNKKNSLFRLHS